MLKKNLVSFEPTTFSLKLTLFLPITNFHSNRFFFELDSTESSSGRVVKSAILMTHAVDTVSVENLLASFCCVFRKDALRRFPLLGDFSKQF